jgi:membrane associated rhomboid family serine protease
VIPLKDRNPTRSHAVVTLTIIGLCVYVYFVVQPAGRQVLQQGQNVVDTTQETSFTLSHAAIPFEVSHDTRLTTLDVENLTGGAARCDQSDPTGPCYPHKNVYLAVLYSMFLHGSLLHIGGNMLFLWIFGNNIEDQAGKVGFTVFYLLAGLVATLTFVAIQPNSEVPLIGASGAIAGVMGAYLVLFPNVAIRSLIILGFFVLFRDVRAKWFLLFWFVSQFFISPNQGVAWTAHVGGFVFGVLAALVWRAIHGGPRPASLYVPPV